METSGLDPVLHLSLPVHDLAAARAFYVDTLGCPPGRERERWMDVWFYGLQLTLQERPDEVLSDSQQGARHFGVALPHAELVDLVDRLRATHVRWLHDITTDTAGVLDGKTSVKLADPSGNVIELKTYPDDAEVFAARVRRSAGGR